VADRLAVVTGVAGAGVMVERGAGMGIAVATEVGPGVNVCTGVPVGPGVCVGAEDAPVTPNTNVWVCSPAAFTVRRWYSCGALGQTSRLPMGSTRSSSR
jgi:hypothetical protein